MKILTVAIPCYNSQDYMRKCIDSIMNQTYKNLDIILVNDGSNDNSLYICKEYAKKENVVVWYSCNTEGTELKSVLPADLVPLFDAVVLFETKSDSTQLRILKVRDETPSNANLKLDSKTLLIAEK